MKRIFESVSVLLCAAACGGAVESNEEPLGRHQDFRVLGLGVDHNDITETALYFLPDDVADEIGDFNEDVDSSDVSDYASEYHVDNCRIEEGFQTVREQYAVVVAALNPASPEGLVAKAAWGSLLHTVQDFYAHSNWVEARPNALFDSGGFEFPSAAPGKDLGGMMVLTNALPSSFAINLPSGSRVPTVQVTGSSGTSAGLITGTFADNDDPSICPSAASLEHGDMLFENGPYGTYLAKDDPDSPHHEQAVQVAERQTTEEFCRLARLVLLRYGEAGLDSLVGTFEANRTSYVAECPDDRRLFASLIMSAI